MSNITQEDRIINYMKKYGKISQKDAIEMGIFRLASRICEIKRAGYPIKTERAKVKNRDQSTSIIAVYSLEENSNV